MTTFDDVRRHEPYTTLELDITHVEQATTQNVSHLERMLAATLRGMRSDLETKMDAQRHELKGDIQLLRADTEAGLRDTTRILFVSVAGMLAVMTALLISGTGILIALLA